MKIKENKSIGAWLNWRNISETLMRRALMWCQISTQVYRFDRVVTRTCGAVSWRSKRRKTLHSPLLKNL